VKGRLPSSTVKIKLSASEKAKWPFLQPQFAELRTDLRDSKSNLLLMVTVAHLALAQKGGKRRQVNEKEEAELRTTIIRLQRVGNVEVQSLLTDLSEEESSRMQKFIRRFRSLRPSKAEKEAQSEPIRRDVKETGGEVKSANVRRDSISRTAKSKPKHIQSMGPSDIPQHIPTEIPTKTKSPAESPSGFSVGVQKSIFKPEMLPSEPEVETRSLNPRSTNSPEVDIIRARVTKDSPVELPAERIFSANTMRSLSTLEVAEVVKGTESTNVTPSLVAMSPEHPRAKTPRAMKNSSTQTRPETVLSNPTSSAPDNVRVPGSGQTTKSYPLEIPDSGGPKEAGEGQSMGGAPSKSDITDDDEEQEPIYAWVTNFTTLLNTEILQLNVHTPFIHNLLASRLKLESFRDDDAREMTEKIQENVASEAMNETMSKLNTYQRQLILKDVLKKGHTLIFVDTWMKERVGTLYGDLEITLLIWFTTGPPLSTNATVQQNHPMQHNQPMQQGQMRGPNQQHIGQVQTYGGQDSNMAQQRRGQMPPPPPRGTVPAQIPLMQIPMVPMHGGAPPPPPPPPVGNGAAGNVMPGTLPGALPYGLQKEPNFPTQKIRPQSSSSNWSHSSVPVRNHYKDHNLVHRHGKTKARRARGRDGYNYVSSSSDSESESGSDDYDPRYRTMGRSEYEEYSRGHHPNASRQKATTGDGDGEAVVQQLLSRWTVNS
jgi:hypothetical protein